MNLQQDEPTLIWDIIYLVLDACIAIELAQNKRLLDQLVRRDWWVTELLLTNRQCRDFLLHSNAFHRLRLWRMLGKTVQQRDSVVIAVEHKNDWTLLDLKISSQPRQRSPQSTEGMCELSLVECRPHRMPKMIMRKSGISSSSISIDHNHSEWVRDGLVCKNKRQIVPIFSYERCLLSGVETFATHNHASISIWRSPSNAWLYRHLKTYRLILDTPMMELLVWNRTRPLFERLSADE